MYTCAARVSAVTLKLIVVVAVFDRIGAAGCGNDGEVATIAVMPGPSAPRPLSIVTCLTWRVRPPFGPQARPAGTRGGARGWGWPGPGAAHPGAKCSTLSGYHPHHGAF